MHKSTSYRALNELAEAAPTVMPSLLLCDFGNLQEEVRRLEEAGVRGLHLDVMDGQFVPNLTYGMPIVEALNRLTDLPLDVHLMTRQPEQFVEQFVKAGADLVTFHVEATDDPQSLLNQIHDLGVAAGMALNPETPASCVEPYLDSCDLVLAMSVNAGFGGQQFNPIALEKLKHFRSMSDRVVLEIDGGVNPSTVSDCADAGAQLLVVGSAIFRQPDYSAAVEQLRSRALAS